MRAKAFRASGWRPCLSPITALWRSDQPTFAPVTQLQNLVILPAAPKPDSPSSMVAFAVHEQVRSRRTPDLLSAPAWVGKHRQDLLSVLSVRRLECFPRE